MYVSNEYSQLMHRVEVPNHIGHHAGGERCLGIDELFDDRVYWPIWVSVVMVSDGNPLAPELLLVLW